MRTYTDKHGTEWQIKLDSVRDAVNIHQQSRFDVLHAFEDETLKQLANVETQAAVLFAASRRTSDNEPPDDPDAFAERFDGGSFEAAFRALLEAISDFFNDHRSEVVNARIAKFFQRRDEEIAAAAREMGASTSSNSSGAPPGSAE